MNVFAAVLKYAFASSVAGLAAFHLAATWMFSAPTNILKIDRYNFFSTYFGSTVLAQNWAFFAPSPVDTDIELYVRARDREGRDSDWIDVSRALVADVQRNRLSQYEFVATGVMNAMNAAQDALAQRARDKDDRDMMMMPEVRPLYRIGASVMRYRFPGERFTGVQVAIVRYTFPRFTQRFKKDGVPRVSLVPLDWKPFPIDIDTSVWR